MARMRLLPVRFVILFLFVLCCGVPRSSAQGLTPRAYLPLVLKPISANFYRQGIQVDATGDTAANIGHLNQLGLGWVKLQLPWKYAEPTQGQYELNSMDALINAYAGANRRVLLSVVKAPAWARPATTDFSLDGPPADPATYASFVQHVASRYCGKVQAIEVWNEQNLYYEWGGEPLDATRYVQLLAAANQAIKAACPAIAVISGAPTPTGAPLPFAVDDFTYLANMYQAGLKSVSDGVGVHPSGYNVPPDLTWDQACAYVTQKGATFHGPCDTPHHSWSFRSTVEGYRNIMLQNGEPDKRLWVTEFGWASGSNPPSGYEYARDNTQADQAAFTVRAYQMGIAYGYVETMILWNLDYGITHPNTEMALWSLLTPQGPVPAYAAIAARPK